MLCVVYKWRRVRDRGPHPDVCAQHNNAHAKQYNVGTLARHHCATKHDNIDPRAERVRSFLLCITL